MRERSRRASPQPDYYRWLSVDAGADLAAKKNSAPSERLSRLRLIRDTHSSSSISTSM